MAYVGFSDIGYEYLNMEKDILFSSDNTHNYLFDYITKDLSRLHDLFEKYISNKMDTTTFNLNKCQDSNVDINTIIEIFKTIHPYFEYEYRKEIQNIIGNSNFAHRF